MSPGKQWLWPTTLPPGLSAIQRSLQTEFTTWHFKSDGTVVAWVYPANGQTALPAGLNGVLAVAAGDLHSLEIMLIVPTITTVAAANGQCTEHATFSAAVSPSTATGSVEFLVNGSSVGSAPVTDGLATFDYVVNMIVGEYPLQAVFSSSFPSFADSEGTSILTVTDTTPPVADVGSLPDVTAQCSAVRPDPPTATDACDGQITATTTSPATFGQGDFTIVWTFNDSHGNSSEQSQQVHVHDTIAPTVTCPNDVTVITSSSSSMVVDYPAHTALDNS